MAAAVFRAALIALLCAGCTSIAADARTFEGTSWRAVAINGRTTPATGNYVVRFQRGQVGGQFGCNHFGGDYRLRGETMIAGAIRTTMMACSEPAASFEGQGFAILNQPMTMRWTSSQRVTLGNSAGSIELERLP